MHFITSVYGNDYVPLLSVCLDSISREHPDSPVTVLWESIHETEIQLLKFRFPKYIFQQQTQNIHFENVHERIPLKLRFWETVFDNVKEDVICFIDCDTLVLESIDSYAKGDFDFLYTWKDENYPLNVGVVIAKNSPKVKKFMHAWLEATEVIVGDPEMLKKACDTNGAADQQALHDLMGFEDVSTGGKVKFEFGEMTFKAVSCDEINQTRSVPVNSGAKVLHYKGGWHPILLREGIYTPNRPEEESVEMREFWDNRYREYNEQLLKDFAIDAAGKHRNVLPWDEIPYEERGILHSEMLAVISMIKELGIEVVIESGRARGQSTAMLGEAFEKEGLPIYSIEWLRDDAAEFAEKNLAKYTNINLLYGDANVVLPELLEKFKDKKVAFLCDGPKGRDAYLLFARVIEDYPNLVVGFFHDCRKSSPAMVNPSRDQIYSFFDRTFFTDDLEYIESFGEVDENCEAKLEEVNVHSWRPYLKGFSPIGSYGPTIGAVFPTHRDTLREKNRQSRELVINPSTTMNQNVPTKAQIKELAKRVYRKGRRIGARLLSNSAASTEAPAPLNSSPVVHSAPVNHLSMGWTTPQREQIIEIALHYLGASHVYGDYVEFGVWRGDTFATAYHFSQHLSGLFPKFKDMQFHALDSFEGFPELKGDDNFPQFKEGGRACSIEDFEQGMAQREVDMTRVKTTKGWFSDTLVQNGKVDKEIKDNSLSLAYIDCDLYESTADVLKFIGPKMINGGLMIFDDWYCFAGDPAKGEQRACTEFLTANPTVGLAPFRTFHWHGISFIFHKYKDAKTVEDLRKNNLVL